MPKTKTAAEPTEGELIAVDEEATSGKEVSQDVEVLKENAATRRTVVLWKKLLGLEKRAARKPD